MLFGEEKCGDALKAYGLAREGIYIEWLHIYTYIYMYIYMRIRLNARWSMEIIMRSPILEADVLLSVQHLIAQRKLQRPLGQLRRASTPQAPTPSS